MPLAVMPRIERLDLARVELPADDPAADLGLSCPVHGFLIEHPDGTILVDTGVQVPPRPPRNPCSAEVFYCLREATSTGLLPLRLQRGLSDSVCKRRWRSLVQRCLVMRSP